MADFFVKNNIKKKLPTIGGQPLSDYGVNGNLLLNGDALLVVAIFAEHLTVAFFRLATECPRMDMVCLHFFNWKKFTSDWTDTLLTFIGSSLVCVTEHTFR